MNEKSMRLTLRYFGHSAFQWTTPQGARVLIDPYRPMDPHHDDEERKWFSEMGKWFVKAFPLVETDLVLITHSHFDHAAVNRLLGLPTIIRTPCYLQYKDVTVQGFKDFHARYPIVNEVHNIIFCVFVNV